jgi:hypothetical protein
VSITASHFFPVAVKLLDAGRDDRWAANCATPFLGAAAVKMSDRMAAGDGRAGASGAEKTSAAKDEDAQRLGGLDGGFRRSERAWKERCGG